MALKFDWRYLDGAEFEDLSAYFRKYELVVMSEAEEGGTAGSTVTAYDPDAVLDFIGHSHLRIWEMSAPEGSRCIWQGHVSRQKVKRGEYDKVGVQRIWELSVDDFNSYFSRRIFDKADADRPAETDIERLTWLLSTPKLALVTDTTYVDTTNPVQMDAVDYQGQTSFSVMDDLAQQSQKNWFMWYKEDTDEFGLWYAYAASDQYSSTLRLSNDLADIDDDVTFAISDDSEWQRDPTRVYSGAYGTGDGFTVFVQRAETLVNYPVRDFVAPHINVKTPATMRRRLRAQLARLGTEEVVVTTTVLLPRAKVNLIMQGMRVQFKATHMPGLEDFTWLRALNRTVREVSEDYYAVTLELVNPAPATAETACPPTTESGSFYPLGGSGQIPNPSGGNVIYGVPGILTPYTPEPGHIGSLHFAEYGAGGVGTVDYAGDCVQSIVRCIVVGDGTIDIHTATYAGSSRTLRARLMHQDPAAPDGVVVDETQLATTGTTITFNVSTHGGVDCTHWVDVIDDHTVCGGKWGFAGFDWTAD